MKRWIREGHLSAFQTAGRHYRITDEEFKRFQAAHRIPLEGPPRILIVDDDERVLSLVVEALSLDKQYKIETARDGYEGLIKVGTLHPHLLILDLRMPGLDGFEVCRKVKADPVTQSTSILAMTAYSDADTQEQIVKAGADGFLKKPFQLGELRAEVARLVEAKS